MSKYMKLAGMAGVMLVVLVSVGYAGEPTVRLLTDEEACALRVDGGPVGTPHYGYHLDTQGRCVRDALPMNVIDADTVGVGILSIDKASLDTLLQKHPDAKLNIEVYEYDEKAGVWNRAREPQCLAQMEAAMRAMEDYTPLQMLKRAHRLVEGAPTPTKELGIYYDIERTFGEAKRDCWRHP